MKITGVFLGQVSGSMLVQGMFTVYGSRDQIEAFLPFSMHEQYGLS